MKRISSSWVDVYGIIERTMSSPWKLKLIHLNISLLFTVLSLRDPETIRFFSGMIGFLITRTCLFLIEKEEQENTFDSIDCLTKWRGERERAKDSFASCPSNWFNKDDIYSVNDFIIRVNSSFGYERLNGGKGWFYFLWTK